MSEKPGPAPGFLFVLIRMQSQNSRKN